MDNASERPSSSPKGNTADRFISAPVLGSRSTLTLGVVELFLCWAVRKGEMRLPTWLLQEGRRERTPACGCKHTRYRKGDVALD